MQSVSCKNCSVSFMKAVSKNEPNHFCTQSCSASFNNKGKVKNKPKVRICKVCGISFQKGGGHRSVAFCVPCRAQHRSLRDSTLGEYRNKSSVQGRHPSWLHAHVRVLGRIWNKKLQKYCQRCKYSLHVEQCHIKALSSFEDSALLGDVNSPDNILILCRNCHWEYDHEILLLCDIPKRDETNGV